MQQCSTPRLRAKNTTAVPFSGRFLPSSLREGGPHEKGWAQGPAGSAPSAVNRLTPGTWPRWLLAAGEDELHCQIADRRVEEVRRARQHDVGRRADGQIVAHGRHPRGRKTAGGQLGPDELSALSMIEETASVVSGIHCVPITMNMSVPSQGSSNSTRIWAPALHCRPPAALATPPISRHEQAQMLP